VKRGAHERRTRGGAVCGGPRECAGQGRTWFLGEEPVNDLFIACSLPVPAFAATLVCPAHGGRASGSPVSRRRVGVRWASTRYCVRSAEKLEAPGVERSPTRGSEAGNAGAVPAAFAGSPSPSLWERGRGERALLTIEQKQILSLEARGYTREQIEQEMEIAAGTLKHRITALRKQLAVPPREPISLTAVRMGFGSPEELG
jgi:hypothetical protein